jgi:hypothetical protein
MRDITQLLNAIAQGFVVFFLTALVYGVGLATGLCTWSGAFVAGVAIQSVAIAMCIWMFSPD